jgi:hypothetical protein
MLYIIIFFIILVIIEYFWFKYINENKDEFFQNEETEKRIKYNKEHEEEIVQFFKDTMNERLYALEHMKYKEWLTYCQKNCVVERDGFKYYMFIYEQAGIDNKSILRCSVKEELLNLNFTIERDLVIRTHIVLDLLKPYEFLPEEMYRMDLHEDGFNEISYTWENPFIDRPEKKNSTFTRFHKGDFHGVIGMGYTTQDLGVEFGNIYYNLVNKYILIFLNIIILIVSIVLYIIDHSIIKSITVLFLSWLLLMYQLTLTCGITNISMETAKLLDITSSVLGVSFLVAVNTFIIRSFDDKKIFSQDKKILKIEITFLFVISVLCLLLTLYKESNFKSVDQMRGLRIHNQLFFNLCLFYNFAICFTFLFFHFNRAIMKKK